MVPESGMVSRCSSRRPLTVWGPPVGSCHPSARLRARIVTLALTMNTPGRSVCTSLCVTVAGSVVNSPTISSRMSSSVTSPSMSPYSLTTKASRRRLRWNCPSCTLSAVPSGTKYDSRPLAVEGAAHQLVRHALHVQQADEVVELAFVHRQARVGSLPQLIEDVLPAL